jgi:hypothetical protein
MTKLRDLQPQSQFDAIFKNYQKEGDNYTAIPCLLYNLHHLPQLSSSQSVFVDEDFVIPPRQDGRSLVKAKIGKLYIEYTPGGKDSFDLSIKYIDKQNQTLQPFLNFQNNRYSNIEFEDLLPFSLSGYYQSRTNVATDRPDTHKSNSHAYELKKVLTKLLLDEILTAEEVSTFHENYRSLYIDTIPVQPRDQVLEPLVFRDVQYFMANRGEKPSNLFEVSAKLAAIALTYLSIDKQQIRLVLREYLEVSSFPESSLNDVSVQRAILNIHIDEKRYALKAIVDDIEPLLKSAISDLRAAEGVTQNNASFPGNVAGCHNGQEIDLWLRQQLPQGLNLKKRKEAYLSLLERHVVELAPDKKKELTLYILNNPDHFLKKERHFFRTQKYSNETFSVYKIVMLLEQGERKKGLITIREEDASHTISRHVRRF